VPIGPLGRLVSLESAAWCEWRVLRVKENRALALRIIRQFAEERQIVHAPEEENVFFGGRRQPEIRIMVLWLANFVFIGARPENVMS
jgi:hypothetical protein